MISQHINFLTAFHKSLLGTDFGRLGEERGLKRNVTITLFVHGERNTGQGGGTLARRSEGDASGSLHHHFQAGPP